MKSKSNHPLNAGDHPVVGKVQRVATPKIRFNPAELASRWDMSVQTLERWRVEGIGPCYLKLRGKILYRLEDIEGFELQSLRQGTDGGAA